MILPPLIVSAALLVDSECGCVGLTILDLCGAMQFFSCEVRHWFGLVWVREKSLCVCYVEILVNNFFFLYFSATPNLCICERKLFGCIGVLDYVKLPLLYLALFYFISQKVHHFWHKKLKITPPIWPTNCILHLWFFSHSLYLSFSFLCFLYVL